MLSEAGVRGPKQGRIRAGEVEASAQPLLESSLQVRLTGFVARLSSAINDRAVASRLETAGVVVKIRLIDVPATLTLLLDHHPPSVIATATEHRPDVRLAMRFEDLVGTFAQGSYLPLEILAGRIEFEGAVRKFLRVLPVLRDHLAKA